MWIFIAFQLAFVVLARSAVTPVNAEALESEVTILISNDLQGPTSPTADSGILLLQESILQNAVASCESLGETLWGSNEYDESAIQPNLDYLIYERRYAPSQFFWIAPKGSSPRALSATGKVSTRISPFVSLPVLCTQSAPYSSSTYQDNSTQWQITVHSNNEFLTGFRDRLSFRFLGIRFAQKPERWTYSQLHIGDGSHVSALDYGSECLQSPDTGSEDCLFLNVWTPFVPGSANRDSTKLKPVMFWIHGGAFLSGTGSDPTFDGGNYASRGDVVVVTINYRLGTLGFLALDDGETKGNFGFADQVTALEWVQQNIQDFGGDPNQITIFGQSAGAASVRAMMGSPKAIGRFSKAIMQSNLGGLNYGTTYSTYYTIDQSYQNFGKPILAETNCTNSTSPLDCLRAVSAETLISLPTAAAYLVVDGTYLTSNELPLNTTGEIAHVPFMLGVMHDDGAAFIGYPQTGENASAFVTSQGYSPNLLTDSLFPTPTGANRSLDIFNATARIGTDGMFRCVDEATTYAAITRHLLPSAYFYEFNRSYQLINYEPNSPVCNPPLAPGYPNGDPNRQYFKCHSGELYFVFGNLDRFGLPFRDENDLPFQQFVLDGWSSFARTADPNPDIGYLQARNYQSTQWELQTAGRWLPVVNGDWTMRRLQWPSAQVPFDELEQCEALGLRLDYLA